MRFALISLSIFLGFTFNKGGGALVHVSACAGGIFRLDFVCNEFSCMFG